MLAAAGRVEVFVWDLATGQEVRHLFGVFGSDQFNQLVHFMPGGMELAVCRGSTTVFYDTRTWKLSRSVASSGRLISPIGPTLVGRSAVGGKLFLRELSGTLPITDLDVRTESSGLALSPDGRMLATFSELGWLEFWSVPGGRKLKSVDVLGDVRGSWITFAPDGKTLFLTTATEIRRWNLKGMKFDLTIKRASTWGYSSITGIHALGDGAALLTCFSDGCVRRLARDTGKPMAVVNGYTNDLTMAMSASGTMIAIGDASGKVDIWDVKSGRRTSTVRASGDPVYKLSFAQDGYALAIGQRGQGVVEVREIASGRQILRVRAPGSEGGPRAVRLLGFSPDSHTILAGTGLGRLQSWNVVTGRAGWAAEPEGLFVFSPDGKVLIRAGPGPSIVILKASTGEVISELKLKVAPADRWIGQIQSLAISPDGRKLAVGTGDSRVRICDAETGEEMSDAIILDRPGPVQVDPRIRRSFAAESLTFSPDGNWLLGGISDGTIRLWELGTRQELRRFTGHERQVRCLGFGSSARTIVSSADDGTVYQWEPRLPTAPRIRLEWEALGAVEASIAYRAIWSLVDNPSRAVALLRKEIKPRMGLSPEEMERLIAKLDAARYAEREAAMHKLIGLGREAFPALRTALTKKQSAEARERMQKLLGRSDQQPSPNEMRRHRAVQVLELANTAEARQLLDDWSSGSAGPSIAKEAEVALTRVSGK